LPGKQYAIDGGRPLVGKIAVAGAKNAVTKQIVATLLCDEPCVLENVPASSEVEATLAMLSTLGTHHAWLRPNTLVLHTPQLASCGIGRQHERLNRIPLLALGPLLHRAGQAWVPAPGGCAIGSRQTDFHLAVLRAMGARAAITDNGFAARGGLVGARLVLPYPSVGATENALLAGVLAAGRTEIVNAAMEPEIGDTIAMLRSMGARIRLAGPRRIVLEGVRRLVGTRHRVMPDRTEAASFAMAAAATAGRVEIVGAQRCSLAPFLKVFRALGGGWSEGPKSVAFFRQGPLRPVSVESGPYPGFSSDWLPPLVVLLTQARGRSTVHETVFEDRLAYAVRLGAAGARLTVSDRCLVGRGCRFAGQGHFHSCQIAPSRLRGAPLVAPDLRGGFAMILAALVADGTTHLAHVERVERGYAELDEKLLTLGVQLQTTAGLSRSAA
jgi:UDP-N-acetylglucosamine 1-carboxyvinyltransferase